MAGFIKKVNPTTKIIFLGRTYTKDVIEVCELVDEFINYDEIEKLSLAQQKSFFVQYNINYFVHVLPNKRIAQLAKAIKIKYRVGTTNRFYHWFTCNSLVKLSRKNSQLHESQLNLKLLSFLGTETYVDINQMASLYGFTKLKNLQFDTLKLLDSTKKKIILHPKSKGSAKEWGLENFSKLIHLIPKDKYQIFVSGTKQDAAMMKDFLLSHQAQDHRHIF